jgi:hypothetical protein
VGLRQDASSKTWRRLEGRIFTSLCLIFDSAPYFAPDRGDVKPSPISAASSASHAAVMGSSLSLSLRDLRNRSAR